MALSGNRVKKLGKVLRDGSYSPADIDLLEQYREEFDPILVATASRLCTLLEGAQSPTAMAGRSKRVKSIIRKLQRPSNSGMDLSRMDDLVGLRVVVTDVECQNWVVDQVSGSFEIKAIRDFREDDRTYRAVHIVLRDGPRLIEVQVRSLPQQLWANESESFGEAVKEGRGPDNVLEYLTELSLLCRSLDQGATATSPDGGSPLIEARAPLEIKLPRLQRLLTATSVAQPEAKTFIVVFDNQINALHQSHEYSAQEREQALDVYRDICRRVDESRHEVLLINASSKAVMAVTHPRFFPEM
jgi:ppGpp synthetase/RelA/SpoT-type nucleotidyltranferase